MRIASVVLTLLAVSGCGSTPVAPGAVLLVPDEAILPSMNADRVLHVPREDIPEGMWGLEQVRDERVVEVKAGDVQKGMRVEWYDNR